MGRGGYIINEPQNTMTYSPFTHKRVLHSENFIRHLLSPKVNPIKNNVENKLDVDIITDLGKLDVQYTTSKQLFVDFISVLKPTDDVVLPTGKRNHPKFWAQVKQMNRDIKVFQSLDYTIEQIFHCLGAYASKSITPGKFMNENYDYVAYVRYAPKSFDVVDYTILDLRKLREATKDPKTVIAFNIKDKWNSLNDLYHSAYIKFPPDIIEASTVTELFVDLED